MKFSINIKLTHELRSCEAETSSTFTIGARDSSINKIGAKNRTACRGLESRYMRLIGIGLKYVTDSLRYSNCR